MTYVTLYFRDSDLCVNVCATGEQVRRDFEQAWPSSVRKYDTIDGSPVWVRMWHIIAFTEVSCP